MSTHAVMHALMPSTLDIFLSTTIYSGCNEVFLILSASRFFFDDFFHGVLPKISVLHNLLVVNSKGFWVSRM